MMGRKDAWGTRALPVLVALLASGAEAFVSIPTSGLRPARGPVQRVHHAGLRAATGKFGLGKLFRRGDGSDEDEDTPLKGSSQTTEALKAELITMCDETNFGVYGKGDDPARFDELVSELRARNPTKNAAESPKLDGRWKMLWTDEREVLFLVEKGLFWDPCLAVYQDFDAAADSLSNVVEFDNGSRLAVQSSFEPLGSRFDFKFGSAVLTWRGFDVPLPPVGQGWSEQIYLDDSFRMAKDSRGVLLVVEKLS